MKNKRVRREKDNDALERNPNQPLFSFKYLQEVSIKKCKDTTFLFKFLMRLKALSNLDWEKIRNADRHGFGMEKINPKSIKPALPSIVTPEVPLFAFRATGSNLPFVGFRDGKIFHILFVETNFGDIYNHE